MGDDVVAWDGARVRAWLESRIRSARLDQAAADRQGYEARDEYDKAAAEEWSCHALLTADRMKEQAGFQAHIKEMIAQDDYRVIGIHDDQRFERHVRSYLRKIARMTKLNSGFEKTTRYQ